MTEEVTQTDAPQLTINDLVIIKEIVDIASSRAAFKPEEMEVIGRTYNKILAFLKAAKDAEDAAAKAEETSEAVDG